jgi:1,2-diacylglycerol 3-alpha-glucosyltransferase
MLDSPERLDIHYVGTLPPHEGGAAVVGAQILQGLAARGHAVRALAPMTSEADARGADFTLRHPALHVTWFHVPRFDNAPDVPPDDDFARREREQIAAKLPTMIGERRPDVIVIGRESFVRHVPDIARAYGVPSLMLVHGDPSRSLIHGAHPKPLADRLLARYQEVDHIVTPGRHMAEGLRRMGLGRVSVIPNGIDLSHFAPRPKDRSLLRDLGIAGDQLILMHASKLERGKRAHDIVDSAERVVAVRPNLVYVIVGHGPLRGSLEEACRRKGLTDRFRFVGWVDHRHMPRYVNLADIVIMPSEAETQALVYLEAQACARLLLASDIPAAREILTDGRTGVLFRMGDVDDLTAKTLHAIDEPRRRSSIGHAARKRVQRHGLDAMTTSYEALVRSVVRRHIA